MKFYYFKTFAVLILTLACLSSMQSCKPKTAQAAAAGDASKSFIAPGKYDEFYNIVSGGFNGQVAVYGIPSGRLFRIIPVFSQSPESGFFTDASLKSNGLSGKLACPASITFVPASLSTSKLMKTLFFVAIVCLLC